MDMNRFIVFVFLSFFINSSSLFSCDENIFPRIVTSLYGLPVIDFLKSKGFFLNSDNSDGGCTQVVVASEYEIELLNFRKKRTKELELMRKELQAIRRILWFSGTTRSDEELLNIQRAYEIYRTNIIPQREAEERLTDLQFFQMFYEHSKCLKSEITATRNRLLGIEY